MASILLIDDDDVVRSVVQRTLATMGHSVTAARDGVEGLALYQSAPADLVLTDLIMPGKEGLELIMELKKKNRAVKIIAMSGGGRVDAVDYLKIALQLGAGRVLQKPFTIDELTAAIADLLAKT